MARFLIDTHVLIWTIDGSPRLKDRHWIEIEQAEKVYFSPVNLFEIAVLKRLDRLKTTPIPTVAEQKALLSGLEKLPLVTAVFDTYISLPLHHRDPYDRLLIAQAKQHDLTIVTADPWFKKYDIKVKKI